MWLPVFYTATAIKAYDFVCFVFTYEASECHIILLLGERFRPAHVSLQSNVEVGERGILRAYQIAKVNTRDAVFMFGVNVDCFIQIQFQRV